MNFVVVPSDFAVGPDEQRARRRALRQRRESESSRRRSTRRESRRFRRETVAQGHRRNVRPPRRDRRRLRQETKNSPARPRASRPAARRRRPPAGFAKIGLHVARARHLHCRDFIHLRGLRRRGVRRQLRAQGALLELLVGQPLDGRPPRPVTQYEARPMPPKGFLKMRVKIRSAAATCGPASSAPTVGNTLPGSAVTTACWR